MAVEVCHCGLIKQSKAGVSQPDGISYCNNCGLPTDISQLVQGGTLAESFGPIQPSKMATL